MITVFGRLLASFFDTQAEPLLSEKQKEVKLAYLEQENNRLRSALLDYQIAAKEISLAEEKEKGE